jgi:hypothetical protein
VLVVTSLASCGPVWRGNPGAEILAESLGALNPYARQCQGIREKCILDVSGSGQEEAGPGGAALLRGHYPAKQYTKPEVVRHCLPPTVSWPDPLTSRMHFTDSIPRYKNENINIESNRTAWVRL